MNQLVTTKKIRDNSLVDDNVSERDIFNAMMLAQKIDLKAIISTELFTEILKDTGIDEDLAVFRTTYLVDLVEYYTVKHLFNLKSSKINAAGAAKDNNDSNIALELAEIRRVISVINGIATSFEKSMLDYISDNDEIFATYYDSDAYNGVTSPPTSTVFDMRLIRNR